MSLKTGKMAHSVIIIGAGLGGLAAAARLAHAGYKVRLFEKNAEPGGKMGQIRAGGYRFDTGPSLLTMPVVLDDLFRDLRRQYQDYLELLELPVICRYFFPDGTVFDATADREKMMAAIERLSVEDARRWPQYQKYCAKLYEKAAAIFLYNPIQEWSRLLFSRNIYRIPHVFTLDARLSMHERNRRFFTDPRMIQLLDRYATYNGSNPFKAPATLNIIAHVEYNPGAYYIKGGMFQLAKVLENICLELGVEIEYNREITAVIHRNSRVEGVGIEDRAVKADIVVCNTDVVYTFNQLISGHERYRAKLNRLEPSLSGMVFLWSVSGMHTMLAHHNIFFSMDYRREFQQIFGHHEIAEDPTVYVSITSKSDAADAPPRCENWFVLVNMPYTTGNQNWPVFQAKTRQAVLKKLLRYGIDIEKSIRNEHVLSPLFFRDQLHANRGSIYGISSNSRFAAFMRPPNRNRQIRNLYFTGGSTHPGGGIPLVLLSGRICAELIKELR